MTDISTWEIFFMGSRTLIGKRRPPPDRKIPEPGLIHGYLREEISPVYELLRVPSERGIATTIFPVGWFPVDSLPLPDLAPAFPVSKLGPAEQRQLAGGVARAEEMLQQMRAAGTGISIAKEMPK